MVVPSVKQIPTLMGTWSSTAYYTISSLNNSVVVPLVYYNNQSFIMANGQAAVGGVPGIDTAWVPFSQVFDASKYFGFLNTAQSLSFTNTASVLTISNATVFGSQIAGAGITLDSTGNFITLAQGTVWVATICAQGNNFKTASDELQIYTSVSINGGGSYTDAPVFLRASSVGIGIIGASVVGSAHTRTIILDTTTNGYNAAIQVQFKGVMVQAGETANIIHTNQFSLSVTS